MEKETIQEKKKEIAWDVAEAMAANMAANMATPNFEIDRERILAESARHALETHQDDLKSVGINLPGITDVPVIKKTENKEQ